MPPIDPKRNLILVQPFPANSEMSKGIIEFLSQYFNVYYVDLPGFIPAQKPLPKIRFDDFVAFIEARIGQLNLDQYILGGISFGGLLVNHVKVDQRCEAILAAGPFLGYKYLQIDSGRRVFLLSILNTIIRLDLEDEIWNSKQSRALLQFLMEKDSGTVEQILEMVDPKTFIHTARMLLEYDDQLKFQELPYILALNPDEEVVKFKETLKAYRDNISNENLRVILTHLPHYPLEPTYEYFNKAITGEEIDNLLGYIKYIHSKKIPK